MGGVLKIPFYYCYECYDDGDGEDVELSTKDKVCPRCGEKLDWLDLYGPHTVLAEIRADIAAGRNLGESAKS